VKGSQVQILSARPFDLARFITGRAGFFVSNLFFLNWLNFKKNWLFLAFWTNKPYQCDQMGRPRKVSIRYRAEREKWQVAFWEGERRRTAHFSKKIDAEVFAREQGWESLDPSLAVSAEERILIGKARGAALAFGVDAEAIVEAGLSAMRVRSREAPPLGEAIRIYIDAQDLDGARASSLGNLKRFLGFFERVAGSGAVIADISPVAVSRAARARYSNPESVRSYMAVVIAFFRWCADAERQWAGPEWFRRIRLRSGHSDRERVSIAEPAQVVEFMANCPAAYQSGFAIAWFAGVRPEELVPVDGNKQRLQWEDIDLEARTIEIRAAVSKTRHPRLIHDCFANLWSWLEAVPKKERTGPVMPFNHRNFKKMRRAIADKAEIPSPWPRDLSRHSFATYSYHYHGLETTINNTGHMDEPKTFFSHYKGSTVKAQAAAYAAIEHDGRSGSGIWYAMKSDQDKARDAKRPNYRGKRKRKT
jgi:integrase